MKKVLLVAVLACLLAVPAFAQAVPTLSTGTREIGLGGTIDLEGESGLTYDFSVLYGVFIQDALEVGGTLGYDFVEGDPDNTTTLSLEGLVDYHFLGDTAFVPYVGGRLGWSKTETGDVDSDAITYGARGGIKYFISDTVGIEAGIQYMMATEDIYYNDSVTEPEDTNLTIEFGIRVLF